MNTKRPLWFKAKRYGWGWVPVTWQGWLAVGLYLVLMLGGSAVLTSGEPETYGPVALYIIWVIVCTAGLVGVSYKTGEKPRWRWGK